MNKSDVKELRKPNNMVVLPVSSDDDFFRLWCTCLKPFINLTNREMEVVACMLKVRHELSRSISDPAILDSVVFSEDSRRRIMQECKLSAQHFSVILSSLKKSGVLKGNSIDQKVVPNITQDSNGVFQFLILLKRDNQ